MRKTVRARGLATTAGKSSPSVHPSVKWWQSLQFRLSLGFFLFSVAIIGAAIIVLQVRGKPLLMEENYRLVGETGARIVSDLQAQIAQVESLTRSCAKLVEASPLDAAYWRRALPHLMQDRGAQSIIAGGGVWPEPFASDPQRVRTSQFWGRTPDGTLKFYDEYNDPQGPGYHHQEWYVPAKYLKPGECFWSRSYMDPVSYQPMVTCTVPIYTDGRLFGVETVDVKLEGLHDFLETSGRLVNGYAFALDRNNKFLSFPREALAKLNSRDSRGLPVVEFMDVRQFAPRQPRFAPIARAIEELSHTLASGAVTDASLVQRIDAESYQINEREARLIVATFADPLKQKPILLRRFSIASDFILGESALVSIFHVPRTYWKLVIVTPISAATASATAVTQSIMLNLVVFILLPLGLAYVMIGRFIIRPLRGMTRSLKAGLETDKGRIPLLEAGTRNELGEIAWWFNRRSVQLMEALEALKASEHEFRTLFNNMPDLFYRTDREGRVTLVTPSAKFILGLPPEDLVGMRLADLYVNPADRDQLLALLNAQDSVEDFQARLRKGSGEVVWMSANSHLLRDATGAVVGVEGTVRDITQRKKMEQEVEFMRAYLKNIIDSMPSILVSIDVDGHIREWNQAATRITGIPAATALGRKFWEVAPLLTPYRENVKEVLEGRQPRLIHRQPYQDGETRYHDVTLFPLVANGVSGLVIRLDDMTETETKDRQLRQAQKMEIIGTLSGGLAHDFNNVLGCITGAISLLRYKREKNGKVSEAEFDFYLTAMEESAQRAADIVRQLLAISRKQELNLVPVDLNTTVTHVMRICKMSIDKQVELIPLLHDKPAEVLADVTQVEQVLLNLCVNAAHAMTLMKSKHVPQGGKLTVSVEHRTADPPFCATHPEAQLIDYWVLSVADTGVGMDQKTIAKIFDPFFTTKDTDRGTGLGLAMVYNIVKQHQGFIDVYSEVGVGSTFCVYLPVLRREDLADVAPPPAEIPPGEGLLLIVDDEEILRDLAEAILTECGYTVLLAQDGIEAVKTYKEQYPAVKAVIMDLVMPRLDGQEACREILAFDPGAKILLTSGMRREDRVDAAFALGVAGFIQKPYTLDKLAQAVHDVIFAPPDGEQPSG